MSLANYPRFQEFKNQNIMAVDYGTKVVGLAKFCPGNDPFPLALGRIIYQNDDQLITELNQYIKDEDVQVVVLGIPYFTDGSESRMTLRVKAFSKLFSSKIVPKEVEIHQTDESLSSFEAKDRMKNSPQFNFKIDLKKIDEVAATIILEDFIKG
jgi:putative Holliday junction resolvase